MSTQTRINISIYATSVLMLLNTFAKPLHIPEPLQWVLMVGIFIPLAWTFYLIKKQRQEKAKNLGSADSLTVSSPENQKKEKTRLVLMIVIGTATCLSTPLWLPLTGTTLGTKGDFIVGLVSLPICCGAYWFGVRMRKARTKPQQ